MIFKTVKDHFDLHLDKEETHVVPRNPSADQAKKKIGLEMTGLVSEIGLDIILPMILGLWIGSTLDTRWATRPRYTLIALGVGFFISMVTIYRTIRSILKRT